MDEIQMVDLRSQYLKLKREIDHAIQEVILSSAFINGPAVKRFTEHLQHFIGTPYVIPCGNGTDALQVALMALNLSPGDEVIVPDFTFIASVEVVALLGLTPVMVDVDPDTFLMNPETLKQVITPRTKAVIPVHLYGQCVNMESLLDIAERYNLFVIEDAAQALGSKYYFSDGTEKMAGAMGHIGCTSFFPSKSLGAFGDGGAIFTSDPELASIMRKIVNHGTRKKYFHEMVGINSRLDAIQAAILDIKLKYLNEYIAARQKVATYYDQKLGDLPFITIPVRVPWSSHIFHQYTLVTEEIEREHFKEYLAKKGIPSMVYYPLPMHRQQAFDHFPFSQKSFPVSDTLSNKVLAIPMHTELTDDQLSWITTSITEFSNV